MRFLDAFDFSSEGAEDIQEVNKPLISASVLGLIFEKINGYKDGSYFTPSFITMYMCRETLRQAVIRKFDEVWSAGAANYHPVQTLNDLYNRINNLAEANAIFNSIRICDPAVGSGHFLVSALNEMIYLKSELGLLTDKNGKRLKDYRVTVENDELIITDNEGNYFTYNPIDRESQRVQETFFHEKQTIIENCLFGVDINPNSVKICQLRLWIELLKHAYYLIDNGQLTMDNVKNNFPFSILNSQLQTLPNIDINIKCGNSLMSRFDLTDKYRQIAGMELRLKQATKKYKDWVALYKKEDNKDVRRQILKNIEHEKANFYQINIAGDPDFQNLRKAQNELALHTHSFNFFETQTDAWQAKTNALTEKIHILETHYNEKIHGCFEWRFEFPEVLDDNGNFEGFDVVIGNPPYIDAKKLKDISRFLKNNYKVYSGTADLSVYFIEKGITLSKGIVMFITTNKFYNTGYGKPVRKLLIENQISHIIDFEQAEVFENVLVSSVILGLQKSEEKTDTFIHQKFCQLNQLELKKQFIDNQAKFGAYRQTLLSEDEWSFSDYEQLKLKEKIENAGKKICNLEGVAVFRGVTTGYNPAFIIDDKKKMELIAADEKNKDIIKPILQGRNIRKWVYNESDENLIFTKHGIEIEKYPLITEHLKVFFRELNPRISDNDSTCRKPGSYKWYEIQDNTAYYPEFEKPEKIIWGLTADKWAFAYDDKQHYLPSNGYILTSKKISVKYLLALLNSKVLKYYFSFIGVMTAGGAYTLKHATIQQLPIIIAENQQPIIALVDQILTAKSATPAADTTAIERQIDEIVYNLYGVTDEEISKISPS